MKNILIVLFIIISSVLFAQEKDGFEIIKLVETTPVKNQQFSNACWSFATTSFIETEILRMQNKEIILSPMFFVYNNYLNQAENYVRMHGQTRFSPGGLTFHAFNVFNNKGCIPELNYSGLPQGYEILDCSDIVYSIKTKLDSIVQLDKIDSLWQISVIKDLNKYMRKVPETFEYKGYTTTSQDFAAQYCKINPNDYIEITSYSHHPFYEKCFLEVPANWYHGEYYNLPINEFMMVIDSALYNEYSLVWDGDISEYPLVNNNQIDYSINILNLQSELNQPQYINQELRQKSFENFTTTEDHLSHLVGIAQDESGNKYYILKDSQGSDKFLNGYMLISEAYLRLKTISVMTHREILEKVVEN